MMNNRLFPLLALYFIALLPVFAQSGFDQQGSRGCRGLMPENTMPAFLKAVEMGVSTIQMDVVISMDGQIVVSHEPWMSPVICSHPGGRPVAKKEAKSLNIYQMKYEEVQKFDCGLRLNPEFPGQHKINAVKPTLKMVTRSVDRFAKENKFKQPHYSIALQSSQNGYDTYTPQPSVFVELIVSEIRRLGIEEITTLQSFDINILEELNKIQNRKFQISYLSDKGKNIGKNLSKLTFKPDIYSPYIKLLSESTVTSAHTLGMKIVPWAVNTDNDKQRMKSWGVDGYITDFPEAVPMN
jgi:glycerophosphoryl diester phosphodiesterase